MPIIAGPSAPKTNDWGFAHSSTLETVIEQGALRLAVDGCKADQAHMRLPNYSH